MTGAMITPLLRSRHPPQRQDIYDRKLSVAELSERIETCDVSYWRLLEETIAERRAEFGVVYHLNCHSMPSHSTAASHLPIGTAHADVVLGDRDATACEAELVEHIESAFRRAGLSVKRNNPYKGVALVEAFGHPDRRQHSAQIEIHRGLHMNEETREANGNYEPLKRVVDGVLRGVAEYAKTSCAARVNS